MRRPSGTAIQQLRARTAELQDKSDRLARALANSRFLDRAGLALSSELQSEGGALDRLALLVVEEYADYCIAFTLDGAGRLVPAAYHHGEPEELRPLAELAQLYARDGASFAETAVTSGAPYLASEVSAETLGRMAKSPEQLAALRAVAPRSELGVPLVARGHTLGAIVFGTTRRSAAATTRGTSRRHAISPFTPR